MLRHPMLLLGSDLSWTYLQIIVFKQKLEVPGKMTDEIW